MLNPVNHLLLVGGGRSVPELARKYQPGVRVSVLCRPEFATRFPADAGFLRMVTLPDDAPVTDWAEAASYVNAVEPVGGLVVINERDLPAAAAIGARLGLPAPSLDTVTAVNDKEVMRSVLRAAGVDRTLARTVETSADVTSFANEAGYPLICKPLAGAGSRGIARIDREADIEQALAYSRSGTGSLQSGAVMAEQFHAGAEYSAESVSQDGTHLTACITAKYTDPAHFVELGHVLPAPLDAATEKGIIATVHAALDALGITSGVTHTEVIVTADGTHVTETHIRPAGDRIPEMLNRARQIDLLALVVKLALRIPVLDEVSALLREEHGSRQYAAIWYACPKQRGRLASVEGIKAAQAVPGVCEVKVKAVTGDVIGDTVNSDARAAYACALAETPDQALSHAQASIQSLVFNVNR
jgi:biotin carboxylase